MTKLPRRFIEDRALRDAARAVLVDDVEQLRASLSDQGLASRVSSGVTTTISGRFRSGAREVMAQLRTQASDHKGWLAALVGVIILWFSRGPILEWLEELDRVEAEDDSGSTPPTPAAQGDPV